MNFKNNAIIKIILIAVLRGGVGGIKVMAKIEKLDGESFYTFLVPPSYVVGEHIQEYIVDAAIAKYGYEPLEKELTVVSEEELKKNLLEIQKQPLQQREMNVF